MDQIDLDVITLPHEVRDPKILEALIEDIQENGWIGRPILLIERDDSYLAWTGCYRIAAAKESGFDFEIPCHVVHEDLLTQGSDAELDRAEYFQKLEIIEKIGDETALQLLRQEGPDGTAGVLRDSV